MAFCAVAREEGRVVCLIVTTIVTTDVAFLAHMFSIMDVVAGFHQCRKVAAGPGAHVPIWRMCSLVFFEVDELGKSFVAASFSRASVFMDLRHNQLIEVVLGSGVNA